MSRMRWKCSLPTAGVAFVLLMACSDQPQPLSPKPVFNVSLPTSYTVEDISTAPNEFSYPEGINDAGVVVGWLNSRTGTHAWWRKGNRLIRLQEPPGAIASHAYAIANNGSIAGSVFFPGGPNQPAYWSGPRDQPLLIPLPSGFLNGDAFGVNNHREVVGTYIDAANTLQAFLWSHATGVTTTLGTLGGTQAEAIDINELGQVVGCSEGANGETHAFRWTSATGMIDLAPSYNSSCAYGLNQTGDAAGFVSTQYAESAAVFLDAGFSRRFLVAGATVPAFFDINNSLISVGWWTVGGTQLPIAADELGSWTVLPTLPGALGSRATAINTCGRIVGSSYDATTVHALLWVPPGC